MRLNNALAIVAALVAGCDAPHSATTSSAATPSFATPAEDGQADAAHNASPDASPEREPVALMTSLPLYWPIDADLASLASGEATVPWPRVFLDPRYTLVPLDTLSVIAPLSSDGLPTDPLEGVARLAIVQPRGLSPADNVALDRWVRSGGRLLLALDPVLTGHYELPLGDPRLPSFTALIPPVVARWGLAIRFDDRARDASRAVSLPGGQELLFRRPGEIYALPGGAGGCALQDPAPIVQCALGKGRVTLVADAAVFEHRELAGSNGQRLRALMAFAFDAPAS